MRQRSFTGPVILIALGVIFLIREFAPQFNLHFMRDFWPFILIIIGLISLMEVLFHASRGNPVPPRPISGWVWLLVVFAALGMWSYRRGGVQIGRLESGGISLLGTSYDYGVNATAEGAGINRIVLENLRGNVSLQGTDDAKVLVTGHRTVRAYDKAEADRVNAGNIKLDRQGETLLIHADVNDAKPNLDISGDLDIQVPRGVSVEVSNRRGDVRITDISKDVKVDTRRSSMIRVTNVKGKVDLSGSGDDVQFETIGGQVSVNGSYSGTLEFRAIAKPFHFQSDVTDMRVEAIPGQVTLDLSDLRMKDVTGPVRFTTKTRDVQIEDATNSVEVTLERGDVQLESNTKALPKMEVHTRRGNLELAMPETAAFDLRASTEQGEVENDFGSAITTATSGRTANAKGVSGKGPALMLVTERGTVTIKKK